MNKMSHPIVDNFYSRTIVERFVCSHRTFPNCYTGTLFLQYKVIDVKTNAVILIKKILYSSCLLCHVNE